MRSGILASLIVVVLCACVIATERPAQFSRGDILIASSGDPNAVVPSAGEDPNWTWDPTEHLAADWESISVSMSSRLYNPAVQPNGAAQGPQWSMSLVGIVDIIDPNGLIGWTTTPTSVLALDQDGNVVTSSTANDSMVRRYQQPGSWSVPAGFPSMFSMNHVYLNLPIDPNATYPDLFSRVEWTMNVLVVERSETVDIPFKASETWVELIPGMEVLVEQATVEEGKYQYRIKAQYDSTKVDYLMSASVHLWRDEMPPAAAVLKLEVLNAEGQSVRDLSNGGGFASGVGGSGVNGQMTVTATGSGSCTACGAAATLRYTLVFNMHELEAHFVMKNIPVPEF